MKYKGKMGGSKMTNSASGRLPIDPFKQKFADNDADDKPAKKMPAKKVKK